MSNGKPSFLPNDEQISNKVRVEHQPVNTDQVVYLITRFDSFIHPRWFYTFLLSTVSLRTFIPISLNRTHGVGGGPSVLGDVGWTVDHLGSCGWIWCPGGTGPFLGDRTGSGWGWLVGCLLAWVCKRIRFIEGVKGYTHVGLVVVCYVMFFFLFRCSDSLLGNCQMWVHWGNWWREDAMGHPKSKAAPACRLPIFLANLNLSNPSKKIIRISGGPSQCQPPQEIKPKRLLAITIP